MENKWKTETHIVLRAKNDTNGNPRRISLLIEAGEVVDTYDHEYRGQPTRQRDGWPLSACDIEVEPAEYRKWRVWSMRGGMHGVNKERNA